MSQEEHRVAARESLKQCRAIMSDPAPAEIWANDETAKALLAEAEALIDPKPSAVSEAPASQPQAAP